MVGSGDAKRKGGKPTDFQIPTSSPLSALLGRERTKREKFILDLASHSAAYYILLTLRRGFPEFIFPLFPSFSHARLRLISTSPFHPPHLTVTKEKR